MSTIPLYNDGQMPGAPEAAPKALVPEARYQADYAGLARVAAEAYEQPELPENWGKGEVMAAQAWGQALSNLGGDMMELANQSAKARNYADLEEARDYMQNETLRYEQWRLENPDTDGWQAEWQRRVTAAQKYFAERRYAPVVRSQVDRDVNQFGERGLIQAGIDAAKVQFSRAGAAVQQARDRAVQQRSIQGVADAGNQAVALKLETPQQSDVNTRHAVQEIHANLRTAMVETQPDVVLKYAQAREGTNLPDEFRNLSAPAWQETVTLAKKSLYNHQRHMLEQVREALTAGPIVRGGREEEWLAGHVPEGMRNPELEELVRDLQAGGVVDEAKLNEARSEMRSHNPRMAGAEEEQARLRMRNGRFPAGIRDELDKLLKRRVDSGQAEPVALQEGRRAILSMHEKEQLTDTHGKPLRYRGEGFLFEALADESKTRVFGIKGSWVEELRGIRDPEKRIQRFRSLVRTYQDFGRPEIADEAGHAAMTDFTKRLFHWGLHGGEFTDLPAKNASAARAEALIQELEAYHAQHPYATSKQVKAWVTDQTGQDRLRAGLGVLGRSGGEPPRGIGQGSVRMTPEGTAIIKPPDLVGEVNQLLSE